MRRRRRKALERRCEREEKDSTQPSASLSLAIGLLSSSSDPLASSNSTYLEIERLCMISLPFSRFSPDFLDFSCGARGETFPFLSPTYFPTRIREATNELILIFGRVDTQQATADECGQV